MGGCEQKLGRVVALPVALQSVHSLVVSVCCLCFSLADEPAAAARSSTSTPGQGGVLNLRLVTPNETIVNNSPVYMVTVPAVTGVMGILADHAPTIAQLQPGVVTVHTNDINDITHRLFVSGGFAVVDNESSAFHHGRGGHSTGGPGRGTGATGAQRQSGAAGEGEWREGEGGGANRSGGAGGSRGSTRADKVNGSRAMDKGGNDSKAEGREETVCRKR